MIIKPEVTDCSTGMLCIYCKSSRNAQNSLPSFMFSCQHLLDSATYFIQTPLPFFLYYLLLLKIIHFYFTSMNDKARLVKKSLPSKLQNSLFCQKINTVPAICTISLCNARAETLDSLLTQEHLEESCWMLDL